MTTAAVGLAVPAACWAHARAAGSGVPIGQTIAVVVLGFPARRDGSPHPVQRWRARLAATTATRSGATVAIFTGAGRHGGASEAAVMAQLARDLGMSHGVEVRVETRSTNTWENVANASAMVEDVDRIVIVSDPLHAARARSYWLQQRPQDGGRVFVTDQSGFWDGWWLKLPAALDACLKHQLRARQHHRHRCGSGVAP
ncbi:MAG: YdcF family protein [Acidimicrobiales bacterium]